MDDHDMSSLALRLIGAEAMSVLAEYGLAVYDQQAVSELKLFHQAMLRHLTTELSIGGQRVSLPIQIEARVRFPNGETNDLPVFTHEPPLRTLPSQKEPPHD